ncbi:MAG: TylF/MycF/NovP-related O-methyltransferase [Halioglobus sp.]
MSKKKSLRYRSTLRLVKFLRKAHGVLTGPLAIIFLTYSYKVHSSYGMTWGKRMKMGFRFWRNHTKVTSGTSWRAHLVIAMRLLEMPPDLKGAVVECGCWKGGSTVNLSLVCRITGRELIVYDSFEGLPAPSPGDRVAENTFRNGFIPGIFGGSLQEVTDAVRAHGAIEVCTFKPGWFAETLPHHEGDIALAFWDVDFFSSLHDCLVNLWPHIVNGGFVFMDEYLNLDYCAVFYSEKFWDKYFATAPPGLVGIGTGVQVGMFYTDPGIRRDPRMLQSSDSIAYCVKGTRAIWEYYPDEAAS